MIIVECFLKEYHKGTKNNHYEFASDHIKQIINFKVQNRTWFEGKHTMTRKNGQKSEEAREEDCSNNCIQRACWHEFYDKCDFSRILFYKMAPKWIFRVYHLYVLLFSYYVCCYCFEKSCIFKSIITLRKKYVMCRLMWKTLVASAKRLNENVEKEKELNK